MTQDEAKKIASKLSVKAYRFLVAAAGEAAGCGMGVSLYDHRMDNRVFKPLRAKGLIHSITAPVSLSVYYQTTEDGKAVLAEAKVLRAAGKLGAVK